MVGPGVRQTCPRNAPVAVEVPRAGGLLREACRQSGNEPAEDVFLFDSTHRCSVPTSLYQGDYVGVPHEKCYTARARNQSLAGFTKSRTMAQSCSPICTRDAAPYIGDIANSWDKTRSDGYAPNIVRIKNVMRAQFRPIEIFHTSNTKTPSTKSRMVSAKPGDTFGLRSPGMMNVVATLSTPTANEAQRRFTAIVSD